MKEMHDKYERQFKSEEEKLLALKQPWQYYRLYVMYEIVDMINSDIDLSEHAIEQLGKHTLNELADLVIEELENLNGNGYHENVWYIVKDLMERSER